jgi:hypothetical protein
MAAAVLLLNQESSFQLDEQWPKFNQLEKLLITLAALAHDFEHPGGVNVSPAQIESISARQVTDLIMPLGLNVENIDLIQRLILATEFEIVPALHQKVAELPTDSPIAFFYRASIILTEADILPSVLPHHGIALAQKLSLEWQSHGVQQRPNPSLKSVHQNFLNKVSFSSPHSKMLQIKELIRSQTLS